MYLELEPEVEKELASKIKQGIDPNQLVKEGLRHINITEQIEIDNRLEFAKARIAKGPVEFDVEVPEDYPPRTREPF